MSKKTPNPNDTQMNPVATPPGDFALVVVFDAATGEVGYCGYCARTKRYLDGRREFFPTHWISAPARDHDLFNDKEKQQ